MFIVPLLLIETSCISLKFNMLMVPPALFVIDDLLIKAGCGPSGVVIVEDRLIMPPELLIIVFLPIVLEILIVPLLFIVLPSIK